ncbi:MAG: pyruvate ferredoxin oxidoreductase [Lachnospiraceae bacterium]|nr:pyruvate ferredoxin oxidoreductase [Lachnospiraceae bacterium]MBQ8118905.1 pyruvate ferredoxin oxidoreductase [Lachnospiraceae bacterium]MBR1854014.1 pyruvate ferredoxin oxidoreductase [Lachnospiraceae bacterium]
MSIRERLSGNEAIATAMRQINPDVFAMFPITPSTEIPQYYAQYVADGRVDTEFICVESEHSSLSACLGAEAAGCRAVTATSSAGLSYMNEVLYVAGSSRLPVVLAVACRALTGPININHDYSDSMAERDSGFIQLYGENNQEVYDNYLMAHRIAEHPSVRLPLMVCEDGFITSHAIENIEIEEDDKVKAFVGEYHPENYLLKKENPLAVGPYGVSGYYMEARVAQAQAMKNAKQVILDVAADFEKTFGRKYGFFEEYRMEDAEVAMVIMGSSAGTAKAAVDELRGRGVKAGLVKIRVFRPFPGEELAKVLSGCKAVAVMDKSEGFSACGGPLFAETSGACINLDKRPKMIDIVFGLGGRDFTVAAALSVYDRLQNIARTGEVGEVYTHMGQREA